MQDKTLDIFLILCYNLKIKNEFLNFKVLSQTGSSNLEIKNEFYFLRLVYGKFSKNRTNKSRAKINFYLR